MTEDVVKLAFWLRAWDSVTIEAEADPQAIDKAKAAAKRAMESRVIPESIDTDRRREGLIAYVDRLDPDRRECVVENVVFDNERIHGPLHDFVRRVAAISLISVLGMRLARKLGDCSALIRRFRRAAMQVLLTLGGSPRRPFFSLRATRGRGWPGRI